MLKYLLEKEFKQLFRNEFIPRIIIIMPCLMMLVFPWATTMDVKNINLSIIDHNHSATSQRLIHKIGSTEYFNITDISPSYSQALESIEYGRSDIIVEIPSTFEQDLVREKKSSILISANAVNANKASIGNSYLSSIIHDFANEITASTSLSTGTSGHTSTTPSLGGISIVPNYKFNPTMDYKVPMVPALMVLVLTLLCGFLPALNVVSEKEIGTIEQINVTPVPKSIFIIGKLLPYWIIGFIAFTISLLIALIVYKLAPVCNIFTLYTMALLYIFTISGLGIIISNFSDNIQQAVFVIFFLIIIMILISGLFTPLASMPKWAQIIAYLSPLTYFVEIMRSLYLKGSSLFDLRLEIYALLIFFGAYTTIAIGSYRKRG